MTVHLVFRCDEKGPADLHRRRFDDATVLDWFRNRWRRFATHHDAATYAEQELGLPANFGYVFLDDPERDRPPPASVPDLFRAFETIETIEVQCEEHCVQVLYGDELDVVVYLFDDTFVAGRPDLTAYLLHDGPLPDGAGEPGWLPADPTIRALSPVANAEGEGRIYVNATVREDSTGYADLATINVVVLDGLRLPNLCRWALNQPEEELDYWGHAFGELAHALRAADLCGDAHERAFHAALLEDADDEATWRAYADWLMERGEPSPGCRLLRRALLRHNGLYDPDPSQNVVRAGEHVAEAFVAVSDGCDHLFFFDDLWGAAHPVLANAMLRYASRWDVLATADVVAPKDEPPTTEAPPS